MLQEATTKDAPAILAVMQAAFEEYRGKLDPPSGVHKENLESVLEKLQSSQVVLAIVEETVAGSVFYEIKDGYLHFGRLAVLPEFRRAGIGRALISYLEAKARELALPGVRLGVRIVLDQLHTYYQRLGYRVIEYRSHQGYSDPTYLIMEKLL
ncbi:MAG: GNAT family N-acetyltransferase [Acidobacteriota bacterium]